MLKTWSPECRAEAFYKAWSDCDDFLGDWIIKASSKEERDTLNKALSIVLSKKECKRKEIEREKEEKRQEAEDRKEEARVKAIIAAQEHRCSGKNIVNTCCARACSGKQNINSCLLSFSRFENGVSGCDVDGMQLTCACSDE